MKEFCEIINCNNEAKRTCISCQKHICDGHSKKDGLWYSFDPYASDFWIFRAILYIYRQNFNVLQIRWSDYPQLILLRKSCNYGSHGSDVIPSGTYRFFYEQVLPKVRLPEKSIYPLREPFEFCGKCFENHVRITNDKLDKDFFPAVRNVQKSGFICGIYDTCLVDVSKVDSHICGNCGKHCCPNHGLKCSACGKIFCTDYYYEEDYGSDYDPKYRYVATGGCAKRHNHFFRGPNYKLI